MNNQISWVGAVLGGVMAAALPLGAIAQELNLTGLSVFTANGAGGFSGAAQWDTVMSDPNWFWDVWVTTEGIDGDFLNLNQTLNYDLTPGEHTVTLVGDARPGFDFNARHGMNLFFNEETVHPGISVVGDTAYDAATTSRPFYPTGAAIANLEAFFVPGAGTLEMTYETLVVTLTDFLWFSSGSHDLDRVTSNLPVPNGERDMVGHFTLNVVDTALPEADGADVPEPTTWLALFGLAGCLGGLRRRLY